MPKELGPLATLVKELDGVKKQVEKSVKDSNKVLGNSKTKNDEEKLKEQFKICYELKEKLEEYQESVEQLEEDNEPAKVKGFDNKKKAEQTRVTKWVTQLDGQLKKILPGEKGEEYLKELKGEEEEEDEEDEEEEEEEEEDEEEEGGETTQMEDTAMTETGLTETAKTEGEEEDDEEDEEEEEEDEEEEEEAPKKKEEKDTKEKETKKEAKKVEKKVEEEEEDDEEEDEEEEEEEDDEEEEEDDEEEEEEEESKKKGKKDKSEKLEVTRVEEKHQFEALYDYAGEQEGDLQFKQGEILIITNTRDDGWWEAENLKGEKGVVPKTYLKMHNKFKDLQEDDEEEDEEEEEEEENEEEEDEEGEEEGIKKKQKKSGKERWGSIKKAVGEEGDKVPEGETSVTDVLHALGAVPSGFRPSTLGPKFQQDETFTMNNYLTPNLSKSNMFYKDLFYDPGQNKIRAISTKLDRIITIQNCKQIPTAGQGLEILGRQVRICLFDGHNILSNIHTVKVSSVDKDQRGWTFSTKISDAMDPFIHSEFFVRGNNTDSSIGILFELCMLYKRTSTEDQGELSCGWTHLPLVEATGNIVNNRQFDLPVSGGTPYEKGVEVDPSISRRTSSSAFMSLMSGNKQPRLSVKVMVPKVEQKSQMDLLPETLVGNLCLLPFYAYHRQILADTLLRDRLDLDSTELIHNPVLTTFPKIADQHDMMKLLRDHWIEKSKTMKRVEMRDAEHMKMMFKNTVLETVYPMIHSLSLPKYNLADLNCIKDRQDAVDKFKRGKVDKKSVMALLLSADIEFTPFDMKEVAFDVIGPHCLDNNALFPNQR